MPQMDTRDINMPQVGMGGINMPLSLEIPLNTLLDGFFYQEEEETVCSRRTQKQQGKIKHKNVMEKKI